MNIPNLLTMLRIFLIPALVIVLLTEFKGKEFVAFAIFVLAALTDMMDGYWARQKKQITTFGKLLDPVADKLLITSAFVCLLALDVVPAWLVIVIISREFIVTGFRAIASSRGIHISSSVLGKIKMNFEVYAIALLILGEKILGQFYVIARIILWIAVIAAVVSATEYYLRFGKTVLFDHSRE